MNINNVKRPQPRYIDSYWSNLNIQAYGKDNLYPQRLYNLIRNSSVGGACLDRYETFIEGDGLRNTEFSEFICNRRGDTIDDLYRLIAQDMALYHGFALHVNYNMMCDIVEVNHIPFQQCRLEEETADGKVVYINVHSDWEGKKTRKGVPIRVDKKNVKKIYCFNPRKEVVLSQIVKSGGIERYRGQILWFSMDGKFVYPVPIYDKVVTNLSIDEGLDNVKYRNVRNNFLVAGMVVHKKGQSVGVDPETGQEIKNSDNENAVSDSLRIFQGDENACALMDVTVENDEDVPKFVSLEGNNFDKKYESTEESSLKKIYIAFAQEPWYRILEGSLGFTGDILTDAYSYYNSYVSKERRAISRELKRIFDNWYFKANPSDDYEIQPLSFINANNSNK